MPAAEGWHVVRKAAHSGSWEVRAVDLLDDAAPMINGAGEVVLGLPVSAVLAQRLRLPTTDPTEFPEMVRIQMEKALPYPPEEVTSDFELIEQTEDASVISAVAVHHEKLTQIADPLLSRGIIPTQVSVYAAQRAATHASAGQALLIYREVSDLVCVIAENGKVGFTHTLDGADVSHLERDLSQVTLTAQLQGIDTSSPAVLLDEALFEARDTVQQMFVTAPDMIAVELPPASTRLNLLPEGWRRQRAQIERRAQWRKRALWAGGIYAGLLLLFFLYIMIVRFEAGRVARRVTRDAPKIEQLLQTQGRWNALAPAIDPQYFPIEVLLQLFENLPSPDVQITTFAQSARQISVDGEAPNASMAYEFAEKVKADPELQPFQFEMAAPRILPNNHAQFRLEGKQR